MAFRVGRPHRPWSRWHGETLCWRRLSLRGFCVSWKQIWGYKALEILGVARVETFRCMRQPKLHQINNPQVVATRGHP